jgi:hypothetical protein
MLSRRRILLAVLLALVLAAGAFTTLDFRALDSQTATDASVTTTQGNQATAPLEEPLQLVVLGGGPVAEGLGDELEAELAGPFAAVNQSAAPIQPWDGPVLVVGVTESAVQYNPVTPRARVQATYGFVGSGNATLATDFATGGSPPVDASRHPYVTHGQVTVTDSSRGLVSLPAYRDHVRTRLAAALAESLTSAPGMD